MTDTEPRPPGRPAHLELEKLLIDKTLRLDRGQLALLKRNVGNNLGEARGCFWFYDTIPYQLRASQAEACFLVATLMASATRWLRRQQERAGNGEAPESVTTSPEKQRPRSFGSAMARLKQERSRSTDGESPVDRRFSILLDAYLEINRDDGTLNGDLPYRLRQMVRMADGSGLTSEWSQDFWAQLLWDVRHWNDPGKPVQKRWARDYYDPRNQADAPGAEAGDPASNTDQEEDQPNVD